MAILLSQLDIVPREVALARRILPVLAGEDRLFLAIANPKDRRVIDELEFVSGRKIYPYVAIASRLDRATMSAYDAKSRGETYYLAPNVPDSTLVRLGLKEPKTSLNHCSSSKASPSALGSKLKPRSPASASMPAIDQRGAFAKPLRPAVYMATPLEALGPDGYAVTSTLFFS